MPTDAPIVTPTDAPVVPVSPIAPVAPVAPTDAPTACKPCTDVATPSMMTSGKPCAEKGDFTGKCNENQNWVDKNYCEFTCFIRGAGYSGVDCCIPSQECTDVPPPNV